MAIAQLPEEERLQVFAELNGYDEAEKPEIPVQEPNIISDSPSKASQSIPLVDDEDLEDASPLSKSSFLGKEGKIPKLYLMVGAAFFVVGFTAFQSFFLTSPRKTTVTAKESSEVVPEEETEAVFSDEKAPVGEIKSELALQSQAQQLKQLNEPNPNIPPPKPKQGQAIGNSNNPPPPTTVKPQVPPHPSPQPQRVAVRRVTPRRTPVIQPTVQRSEPVRPSPPPRPVPSPPPVVQTPPQDPQQAWLAAAQIGSYGSVTSEQSPVTSNTQTLVNPTQLATRVNEELVRGDDVTGDDVTGNYMTGDCVTDNCMTDQELPILQERARVIKHIPMGVTARGQIDRAVAWESGQPPQMVQIRLLEPLLDETGQAIAYEGSFLIVQINGALGSGLVSMTAKTLVALTETGQYREIPLTPASIDVASSGGQPLMAQPIGGTDEPKPSKVDMGRLVLDGVSTALPFFSDGTNGYQDLYRMQQVERFYQRNFAQQQPRQYRPNVRSTSAWMIPAGWEVEIYISQGFEVKE